MVSFLVLLWRVSALHYLLSIYIDNYLTDPYIGFLVPANSPKPVSYNPSVLGIWSMDGLDEEEAGPHNQKKLCSEGLQQAPHQHLPQLSPQPVEGKSN